MIEHNLELAINPSVDSKTAIHLMECFSSAEEIVCASVDDLIQTAQLNEEIAKSIAGRSYRKVAENELEFIDKYKIRAISADQDEYPQRLKECNDYPHLIYVKGDTDFNQKRWLSVVGTRNMTNYGRRMCEEIVSDLARMFPDLVIVSGMAYGIDVTAQVAAMNSGLVTVSVAGVPLNKIYPEDHRPVATKMLNLGGAMVTEYYTGTGKNPMHFVERNRIIAGLSEGTLVIESPSKGGSLYTANMASGYHRSVMAVPGRSYDKCSDGTNSLIKNMVAQMVCTAKDVAEALCWDVEKTPREDKIGDLEPIVASQESARVLSLMKDDEPVSYDQLEQSLNMAVSELSMALFDLEMEGLIRVLPGKLYIRRR